MEATACCTTRSSSQVDPPLGNGILIQSLWLSRTKSCTSAAYSDDQGDLEPLKTAGVDIFLPLAQIISLQVAAATVQYIPSYGGPDTPRPFGGSEDVGICIFAV